MKSDKLSCLALVSVELMMVQNKPFLLSTCTAMLDTDDDLACIYDFHILLCLNISSFIPILYGPYNFCQEGLVLKEICIAIKV